MYDDLSHVYVGGSGPGEALACARADGLDQMIWAWQPHTSSSSNCSCKAYREMRRGKAYGKNRIRKRTDGCASIRDGPGYAAMVVRSGELARGRDFA
jgi:hypothetical protein